MPKIKKSKKSKQRGKAGQSRDQPPDLEKNSHSQQDATLQDTQSSDYSKCRNVSDESEKVHKSPDCMNMATKFTSSSENTLDFQPQKYIAVSLVEPTSEKCSESEISSDKSERKDPKSANLCLTYNLDEELGKEKSTTLLSSNENSEKNESSFLDESLMNLDKCAFSEWEVVKDVDGEVFSSADKEAMKKENESPYVFDGELIKIEESISSVYEGPMKMKDFTDLNEDIVTAEENQVFLLNDRTLKEEICAGFSNSKESLNQGEYAMSVNDYEDAGSNKEFTSEQRYEISVVSSETMEKEELIVSAFEEKRLKNEIHSNFSDLKENPVQEVSSSKIEKDVARFTTNKDRVKAEECEMSVSTVSMEEYADASVFIEQPVGIEEKTALFDTINEPTKQEECLSSDDFVKQEESFKPDDSVKMVISPIEKIVNTTCTEVPVYSREVIIIEKCEDSISLIKTVKIKENAVHNLPDENTFNVVENLNTDLLDRSKLPVNVSVTGDCSEMLVSNVDSVQVIECAYTVLDEGSVHEKFIDSSLRSNEHNMTECATSSVVSTEQEKMEKSLSPVCEPVKSLTTGLVMESVKNVPNDNEIKERSLTNDIMPKKMVCDTNLVIGEQNLVPGNEQAEILCSPIDEQIKTGCLELEVPNEQSDNMEDNTYSSPPIAESVEVESSVIYDVNTTNVENQSYSSCSNPKSQMLNLEELYPGECLESKSQISEASSAVIKSPCAKKRLADVLVPDPLMTMEFNQVSLQRSYLEFLSDLEVSQDLNRKRPKVENLASVVGKETDVDLAPLELNKDNGNTASNVVLEDSALCDSISNAENSNIEVNSQMQKLHIPTLTDNNKERFCVSLKSVHELRENCGEDSHSEYSSEFNLDKTRLKEEKTWSVISEFNEYQAVGGELSDVLAVECDDAGKFSREFGILGEFPKLVLSKNKQISDLVIKNETTPSQRNVRFIEERLDLNVLKDELLYKENKEEQSSGLSNNTLVANEIIAAAVVESPIESSRHLLFSTEYEPSPAKHGDTNVSNAATAESEVSSETFSDMEKPLKDNSNEVQLKKVSFWQKCFMAVVTFHSLFILLPCFSFYICYLILRKIWKMSKRK